MNKRYKKAFTLVELLVVISIVGLLSSVAVVNLGSSRAKAKVASGQSQDTSINHAIGDQIIGEWLFDEASGAVARDTSGNSHDGALVNATRIAGFNGNAYSFNYNGRVSLGSDVSLNPSNFTITAWVKPSDFSTWYNYIYSNAGDSGTNNGINFAIQGNVVSGEIWNGINLKMWSNGRVSNDPVWTFVAMSYDGSKMSLYINGHLDKTTATALGVGQPATYGTLIGELAVSPGSYGMRGSIDQVRLYGSAIVAANIEKAYLAERGKYLAKN